MRDNTARRRKRRGITNRQASFLADLQRQFGLRYTGNGMSAAQASAEIDRLLELREIKRRDLDRRYDEKVADEHA
jgi:hypothetical protein